MSTEAAAVAETHVSYIFFFGEQALKIKKPIRTDFLDFSTLDKRRAACAREVELNRRFCPDVYLGVDTLLDQSGAVREYLVAMRRMDPARCLSRLVQSEAGAESCLEAVADAVAGFHADAPCDETIAANGKAVQVQRRWEDNLQEMAAFPHLPVDAGQLHQVGELARSYLRGRTVLFDRRVAEGRVRDVHGDLLADDIYCYPDRPRILDCIEFDDRLRFIDVVDDAAFLAMDLERLAGPAPAEAFLSAYRRRSGDDYPASLAEHYIAYRALVRAKIASIRHEQGDAAAAGDSRKLLDICSAHLRRAQVPLIVIGGLPGTGKSTLAAGLARRSGWAVIRSDVVRRQIVGSGSQAGFREGAYSAESTARVYRAMFDEAALRLSAGEPVILDASFVAGEHRSAAAEVARSCFSPMVALNCVVDSQVARGRIRARLAAGRDPSEATEEIATALAAESQEWAGAYPVDTSGDEQETLAIARRRIAESLDERDLRP